MGWTFNKTAQGQEASIETVVNFLSTDDNGNGIPITNIMHNDKRVIQFLYVLPPNSISHGDRIFYKEICMMRESEYESMPSYQFIGLREHNTYLKTDDDTLVWCIEGKVKKILHPGDDTVVHDMTGKMLIAPGTERDLKANNLFTYRSIYEWDDGLKLIDIKLEPLFRPEILRL